VCVDMLNILSVWYGREGAGALLGVVERQKPGIWGGQGQGTFQV
jgi:hypothetical protein